MPTNSLNSGPEKGCQWVFAPQEGGREDGPNDAMMQNFRSKPYNSLVRESVQNSLDAVNDQSQPVTVEFKFGKLTANNFPNFFDLKKHIEECRDYFSWNGNAFSMYTYMSKFFTSNIREEIDYIRVADSNTKGMEYTPGSSKSPFYAFARAAGVSSKIDQQSGGSFGFGKSAYFQLSTIGTVFISTLTAPTLKKPSSVAFEGVSWLCSHNHDGQKVSSVGYYDNNNGKPVVVEEDIPTRFSRKGEPGTSFFIIGFDKTAKDEAVRDMVEETLRSFWLAIYRNRLVVKIEDMTIDKDSLEDYIIEYFPDENDTTRNKGHYYPRPYYNAVAQAESSPNAKCFTETLPTLGECSLYLIKCRDAKDKILYMRKPLMLVYSKRTQSSYGVFGVFVCENDKGDKILQSMENPAHDEWKPSNWRNTYNKIDERGEMAKNEIADFVQRCFSKLFASSEDTALEITGLEDLLYIPEDLLANTEEGDQTFGNPTGQIKEEGLSITSDIADDPTTRESDDSSNIGSVKIALPGSTDDMEEPDDGETDVAGIGGHTKKHSRKKGGKPTAGNTFVKSNMTEDGGTYKAFLPVEFRVVAQKEKDKYFHNLIIHSPRDVIDGELELVTIGEQTDDVVDIIETDNGEIKDNLLTNVVLEEGKNTIKILFSDNMRHALKLKAYENQ
jgi:hypothetical protein